MQSRRWHNSNQTTIVYERRRDPILSIYENYPHEREHTYTDQKWVTKVLRLQPLMFQNLYFLNQWVLCVLEKDDYTSL